MKVLFYAGADFFPVTGPKKSPALKWIQDLADSLVQAGDEIEFFDSENTKLTGLKTPIDVIHVFSEIEPQLWPFFKELGSLVVVTPSWEKTPNKVRFEKFAWAVRLFRAIRQRRWPPRDRFYFSGQVDHFLVSSQAWRNKYCHKIPKERVSLIDTSSSHCLTAVRSIYQKRVGKT